MAPQASSGYLMRPDEEVTAEKLRRIIAQANFRNFDQTAMGSLKGLVLYQASAPSDTDALWYDNVLSIWRWHDGAGWAPLGGGELLMNKSGSDVGAGAVLIASLTDDNAFTVGSTLVDYKVVGVAAEAIANNTRGVVAHGGVWKVNCTSVNIAIGVGITHSASSAMAEGGGIVARAFGITVQAANAGNNYQPLCLLFGNVLCP